MADPRRCWRSLGRVRPEENSAGSRAGALRGRQGGDKAAAPPAQGASSPHGSEGTDHHGFGPARQTGSVCSQGTRGTSPGAAGPSGAPVGRGGGWAGGSRGSVISSV